jgi:hypothetical protein
MSEHTERTSAEEVLQASELAARLLRRLIAPGVIDTQRLYKTYARLTEMITHAHPLLHDLLARYSIAANSTLQNLPFVNDQPWMLNVNSYVANNSSFSSTTNTTNNSFFAGTNQFISSVNTTSSTHTELLGTTHQPEPLEKFRVRRGRINGPQIEQRTVFIRDHGQSVAADADDAVLNPVPKSAEILTSSMVHVEGKGRELANAEDTKGEQDKQIHTSGSVLSKIDDTAPATPPTLTLVNKQTNLTLLSEKTVSSTSENQTPMALPQKPSSMLGHGQYRNAVASGDSSVIDAQRQPGPTTTFEARAYPIETLVEKQQLVFRKNADSLTLRELVSDLSSSSPLATVRKALDSLPVAQPSSAPLMKSELPSRTDEPPAGEEITTEGMLRRISKMLLIERERRGY